MLSTIHGRHILSLFEEKKILSFAELKERFLETKEMNQTTLYRILERFLNAGKIHRIEYGDDKFFTLCQCGEKKDEAVELKYCANCHTIEDHHSPLSPESLKSETIKLMKHCEKCS